MHVNKRKAAAYPRLFARLIVLFASVQPFKPPFNNVNDCDSIEIRS